MVAFIVLFFICFAGAKYIYNVLVMPYVWAVGGPEKARLIYTAPLEYLFTQIKIAAFGAGFFAFPVIATQIYKFVAPGLYKNERDAFRPYLFATPVFFVLGAAMVFFFAMPVLMKFSIGMQQAAQARPRADRPAKHHVGAAGWPRGPLADAQAPALRICAGRLSITGAKWRSMFASSGAKRRHEPSAPA
jgi:hypothetical protein